MTFKEFSQTLAKLESTPKRLAMRDILSELFEKITSNEIDKAVYLSLGILAPSYKGIVFNMADKLMIQVLAKAYVTPAKQVLSLYKNKGDLGIVAYELADKNKKTKDNFSITKIYDLLLDLAKEQGEGSVERRINKMSQALSQVDSLSAKYLARIPVGKLRLGFSDATIIDALIKFQKVDKNLKPDLELAYKVLPDIGLLAKNVKGYGITYTIKNISPVVGIPVLPMLSQRLNSPAQMIEKMKSVAVEPKFDGVRLEIHFKRGKFVKTFSRNLNDITHMFPELNSMSKEINGESVILDIEAVGMDEKRKALVDFQTTMQRRRKHDIGNFSQKIPLQFNVFDILHKDGKSLIRESYENRRKILEKTIKSGGSFKLVESMITSDAKEVSRLYTKYLKEGLEGVMVKKASSEYIPGRTGWRWVKMKQEEASEGKLSDTIDCIVMGFTTGQGKRVGFGVGQFLVGIKDHDQVKTITKVGTGLTDEQFRELNKRLQKIKMSEEPKGYEVPKELLPDFWVRPSLIVEIAADDITVSPKHTSGYALRFPRLVKFRDDKGSDQATTLNEIKNLFALQTNRR